MGLLNCQQNIKRAHTQIKRKENEDWYFLHILHPKIVHFLLFKKNQIISSLIIYMILKSHGQFNYKIYFYGKII